MRMWHFLSLMIKYERLHLSLWAWIPEAICICAPWTKFRSQNQTIFLSNCLHLAYSLDTGSCVHTGVQHKLTFVWVHMSDGFHYHSPAHCGSSAQLFKSLTRNISNDANSLGPPDKGGWGEPVVYSLDSIVNTIWFKMTQMLMQNRINITVNQYIAVLSCKSLIMKF